jgi:hypothetical protein
MVEPFRKSTGEVLRVIHEELSPYVGRLMASTAAAAHCRELGFHGAVLERPQVDLLLQKLQLGLIIFLGKDKTQTVIQDVQRAIARLEEVS